MIIVPIASINPHSIIVKYSHFLCVLFCLIYLSCGSDEDPRLDPRNNPTNEATGFFIDDWTYEVYSKEDDNFETAQFRLWLPADKSSVRGLLMNIR